MHVPRSRPLAAFAVLIAACLAASAVAQLEPSLFSLGERLSGFNEPSVQGIGMGGALVALDSADPINPAQNAELDEWWVQVRGGWLHTGVGTDIDSFMVKANGQVAAGRMRCVGWPNAPTSSR